MITEVLVPELHTLLTENEVEPINAFCQSLNDLMTLISIIRGSWYSPQRDHTYIFTEHTIRDISIVKHIQDNCTDTAKLSHCINTHKHAQDN